MAAGRVAAWPARARCRRSVAGRRSVALVRGARVAALAVRSVAAHGVLVAVGDAAGGVALLGAR